MTFNFLGPGLTVNVEAKVKEQIILDSSELNFKISASLNAADTALFSGFLACSVGGAKKSNSSCLGNNRAMLSLHIFSIWFAEIRVNGAFLRF